MDSLRRDFRKLLAADQMRESLLREVALRALLLKESHSLLERNRDTPVVRDSIVADEPAQDDHNREPVTDCATTRTR